MMLPPPTPEQLQAEAAERAPRRRVVRAKRPPGRQATRRGDPPTDRQRILLRVIQAAVFATGHAPTYREMADALGISSTNAITDHLKVLEKKGYLTRDAGIHRGLVLTEAGRGA